MKKLIQNSRIIFIAFILIALNSCQTIQKAVDNARDNVKVEIEDIKFKLITIELFPNKNIHITSDNKVMGIEQFSISELIAIPDLILNNPSQIKLKKIEFDAYLKVENKNNFTINIDGFKINFAYTGEDVGQFDYKEKLEYKKNNSTQSILKISIPLDTSYTKLMDASNPKLDLNGVINLDVKGIKFPVDFKDSIDLPVDKIKRAMNSSVKKMIPSF